MPPIFKALASITVWVLFIFGWLLLVILSVMGIARRVLFVGTPPPLIMYVAR